jgi:hypothetical protein
MICFYKFTKRKVAMKIALLTLGFLLMFFCTVFTFNLIVLKDKSLLYGLGLEDDCKTESTFTPPPAKTYNLVVGKKYVLKTANNPDPAATIRLIATPGAIAAYDDTEEADSTTSCQHIAQGTPVSVLEIEESHGIAYARVQIEDGACKRKNGWALPIDVQ